MEFSRLEQIARILIEDMLEENKEDALRTLRTGCDFTESDCKFFGINYEELKSAGVKETRSIHDMDCEKCSHSYFEDDDKLRCELDVCTPKYS